MHTTEYNVSSNEHTLETGGTVLFRRRDVDELERRLRDAGHSIDIDYTEGTTPRTSTSTCRPTATSTSAPRLSQHVTTSLALVIEKGGAAPTRPGWLRLRARS